MEEQEKIEDKQDEISDDYIPLTQEELEEQIDLLIQKENLSNTFRSFQVSNIYNASQSVNMQVDLVFVVDTTGSMSNAINNVKTYMGTLVTSLYNERITPYVAVVDYTDYINYKDAGAKVVKNKKGDVWATKKQDAINLINQLAIRDGCDETPIDGLEMARRLNFRSGATKFMVLITDEDYYTKNRYGVSNLNQMADLLKNGGLGYYNNKDIITSVVTTSSLKNTYNPLNTITTGTYFNIYSNFSPQLKDFIISRI